MRLKKILLSLLVFSFINTYSQEITTVSAVEDNIGKNSGMGFKTRINRAEEKTIVKEWKSVLKDYDGKINVKGSVISAEEVKIESMGSDPLKVTAEIRNVNKTEYDFFVLFYKNGQYVDATNDLSAFTAAKTIVRLFSNKLSQEATNNYQKEQIKKYDSYTSELAKLKKEQDKAEKLVKNAEEEIKAAQQLIKEKTRELADNKDKQAETEKKVEKQKQIVKGANAEAELYK